jgi:hypothetical protein
MVAVGEDNYSRKNKLKLLRSRWINGSPKKLII